MAALTGTVPGFDLADLRDGDKEMWLIRIPKQLSADSLCGPMTKSKLKLQNHAALRTHGQGEVARSHGAALSGLANQGRVNLLILYSPANRSYKISSKW